MTRSSPASASRGACPESSEALVVRATSTPVEEIRDIRSSRSGRSSGSPPVMRTFSSPSGLQAVTTFSISSKDR